MEKIQKFQNVKKNIFVRKLYDGFIQTCEVWFDTSPMFTGSEIIIQKCFIYHISASPKGSFKIEKILLVLLAIYVRV